MLDRETIEISLAVTASALLIISEGLALSKKSDCNSVSEFLVNVASIIGTHLRPQGRGRDTPPAHTLPI